MPKIAVIAGTQLSSDFLKDFEQQIVKTMYGNVILFVKGKNVLLLRNGKNKNIPSYRVNHKAHVCALNLHGVERIISIEDAKSLNAKVKPGELVLPTDYIDFNPESFCEFEIRQVKPELSSEVAKDVKSASKKIKVTLKEKSVYLQLKGTRKETKAEVAIVKCWADIFGSAIATEGTLANELALPYAALCIVTDYAQGIGKIKEAERDKKEKQAHSKVERIIKEIFNKNKK
jgi:5'-methylthioadenosine phosphorylase